MIRRVLLVLVGLLALLSSWVAGDEPSQPLAQADTQVQAAAP